MMGLRVFTQNDMRLAEGDARTALHRDAIAMGDYGPSSHGTWHEGSRFGGERQGQFALGRFQLAPYQIPYGTIAARDVRNVLAPVPASASHVGFCALRLEHIWTSLGQAAGHAASLAYPVFLTRDKGVPWGCYGQSFDRFAPPSEYFYRDFLGSAEFLYSRDSDSVELLRRIDVEGPEIGFAPDATFAFDLRDDEAAERLLEELGLEPGRFLVAISHYRARGEALEKFADVLEKWVRRTGLPVLLAPEVSRNLDQYSEELLPLTDEELRPQVRVMNRFWLPDEAASVLQRATAVFSGEMHSIIIALAAGTPSMLFRLQGTGDAADALAAGLSREEHIMSDGLKGRMMEDIGLGEWLVYHAEESDPEDVSRRLVKIFERPVEAREKVREAMQFIEQRQAATMQTVRRAAGLPEVSEGRD